MEHYSLPKEFAEKWISNLRSGEYKQTREILFNEKKCGYCCLGVAAHMQGITNDKLCNNGELFELLDWGTPEEDTTLTTDFGIPNDLICGKLKTELITMNDDLKKSFESIADWIEENVEFI